MSDRPPDRSAEGAPKGFWQWMRHHAASIAATVADYLVMISCVELLHLSPVAATPLGALSGAVTNFTLGRRFTYKTTDVPAPSQAWRYALVSAASLGLNTARRVPLPARAPHRVSLGPRDQLRDREQRLELPDAAIFRILSARDQERLSVRPHCPSPPHEPEPTEEPEGLDRHPRSRTGEPGAPGSRGPPRRAGPAGLRAHGGDRRRGGTRQRGHRRRRERLPRLHRRHQRERARAQPPDAGEGGAGAGGQGVGRLVHLARARRAQRAAGGQAAGAGRPPAAALFGRRRGGRERAPPRQVPHRQVRDGQLLGRLPRQDDGGAVADGVDLQGQARTDGAGLPPDPLRRLLPLPRRPFVPELRPRLRGDRPQAGQDRRRGRDRGRDRRADAGDGRQRHPAEGVPAGGARAGRRGRRAAHRRRDDHRPRAHREALGARPHRRPAGRGDDRQGVRRRVPAVGPAHHRRDRAGEALGKPFGLVVELRRQPAGGRGRRRRAQDHRRGRPDRKFARRRRRAQARAGGVRRSLSRSSASSTGKGSSSGWSWSRTRRPRSRCRAG